MTRRALLVACQDCDLLQQEADPSVSVAARCHRCGTELYRQHAGGLERSLAYVLAASVLFLVANAFPIVGLQIQSEHTQATLYGAARTLMSEGMFFIAGLVLLTTMLVPALQIAALTYLLLPLHLEVTLPYPQLAFRLLRSAQPWGMIDVFMLGLLVSLVKLSHLASVVPGIALWSFAALLPLLAAAISVFDPREYWARVEANQ
jgi:paraquat-inducible protein A